jgi:hypothetical protein
MPIVSVKVLAGTLSKGQRERLPDGGADAFANGGARAIAVFGGAGAQGSAFRMQCV